MERRNFLAAGGASVLGSLLASCGGGSSTDLAQSEQEGSGEGSSTPAPSPSPSPAPATIAGPATPRLASAVATSRSALAASTALPAKQYPATTATRGQRPDRRAHKANEPTSSAETTG